jgi:hypothetical protein
LKRIRVTFILANFCEDTRSATVQRGAARRNSQPAPPIE